MLYRDYLKSKYQNTAVKLANAEGVPCVLEYSKGKNMRNYEVYGNSVQDGTPTPESPVEIQSVGDLVTDTESEYYGKYDIPITVCGKNLLSYPYNFTTRTENGLTFTDNGDGSIKINGTATNRTGFMLRSQIIDIIDKTKAYVLSGGKDSDVYLQIDFYNGTTWKKLVDTGNDGKAIIDFTKMNFDYTRVSVALVVKANTVCDNITIKPQLELGETATEYEPYRVPVTANIYLDEPLRKIGDYADYIDFKGQRVVRKVGVLDNTSTKPISESLVALAIPTEEPIPLPALKTFKGTNIISVDTSVQPSNIKAKYVRL